jgi:hypothetical protein
MPKTANRWILYTCAKGQVTPLSRQFKTKAQAEKARQKYPDKERRAIGIGVVHLSFKAKV